MRKPVLATIAAVLALGADLPGISSAASAETPDASELPRRGRTFTTERDVTRVDERIGSSRRNKVFILRGMEKASNQPPVTLPAQPAAAKKDAEKTEQEPEKKVRNWRRRW